jgi:isopenicillin-N epimerase
MLAHWAFDPEITYLNHGTVGAPPKRVLAAQQAIRDDIERQPSRYMLRELVDVGLGSLGMAPRRLETARAKVAEFLGARADDLVFVDNATTGVYVVLRALRLREGDEIVMSDHTYGGVVRAAKFVARECGAVIRTAELPYPVRDEGSVIEAFAGALGPRTKVAIVDHVTSESALVLPLAEIAARCRKANVPVLADGAHAPGALPVDIPALVVDWYSGNLHKWAYAPRSCGILWAAPGRQDNLHPPVVSWALDKGFPHEFDWLGTRDPSANLAAPEGIAFMRELGFDAVRAYNHALAWEAAETLTKRWRTDFVTPESMIGTMATFPLPARLGSDWKAAARLRDALLVEDKIEIQLHAWKERLWVRVSAQIYNDMADIERLGKAIAAQT